MVIFIIRRLLPGLLGIILALGLCVVSGWGAESAEMTFFEAAQTAYRIKKYQYAAESFAAFLHHYPRSSLCDQSYFWLARTHFTLGNTREGTAAVRQIVQEFPDSPLKAKVEEWLLAAVTTGSDSELELKSGEIAAAKQVLEVISAAQKKAVHEGGDVSGTSVEPVANPDRPGSAGSADDTVATADRREDSGVGIPVINHEQMRDKAEAEQPGCESTGVENGAKEGNARLPLPASEPVSTKRVEERGLAEEVLHAELEGVHRTPVIVTVRESAPGDKGVYTLIIGENVVLHALDGAQKALKQAGLTPVLVRVGRQGKTMTRLLVADFVDEPSAQKGLAKLAKTASGAFVLRNERNYSLFAGSYVVEAVAVTEQKHLARAGVKTILKKSVVPITLWRLSAGRFKNMADAKAAATRLAPLGVFAKVGRTQ